MKTVDTSVVVSAALPAHAFHASASPVVSATTMPLLAQVGVETYSVLTRLPPAQRVPPPVVREYLHEAFALPLIALSPHGYARLLDVAAAEGIVGGAVYDALVGATALEAGITLLTLDRRAVTTYRLLGVDYELVA